MATTDAAYVDMIVYHVADSLLADRILAEGFADDTGTYKDVGMDLNGVFVTDRRQLRDHDDADEVALISVDVPEHVIADFEIIEDVRDYRKWCVPASVLNRYGQSTEPVL